jgi:prevent-host-death family protein
MCTLVYMQIGIRELRADLAGVVRRAAAGESVVVTVGGRPVARLGALEPTGGPTLDDLVAVGAVLPPRTRRRTAPEVVDVPIDARSESALRRVR